MAPASELVRVVRAADGALLTGRALPGRGAWLCADSLGCFELAERRRAFTKALRHPIPPEAVARLRAELRAEGGGQGR